MKTLFRNAILILATAAPAISWAGTPDACGNPQDYAWLTDALNKSGEKPASIDEIKASAALGLCQATLNNSAIIYVNPLTRSVISGNLYTVTSDGAMVDETGKALAERTKKIIAAVPQEDTISYPAAGEPKAHIYVLTDTDCGYCRKLQEEVSALNKAGIEVRYLPFVRGGEIGTAYETMTGVWCSEDRQGALSKAFTGTRFDKASCPAAAAVEKYQAMGTQLQLRGTPHIVFPNGKSNSGYMKAEDLIKIALKNQSASK